jgi:(2R)-3-sulfolactate dehydrogenase (NADP+)
MSVITITIDRAVECCCAALKNSGTPEDNARITAQALVRAESDGQKGHGFARVPSYAAQARSGKVRGGAKPEIIDVKPGLFRIDAGFGFAYPAINLALSELVPRVRKFGIAAAAIYQSHHFGVAGHPCEDLARQGFVAFIYGNTPKAMAPFGASQKVLGTNPIAFAAPFEQDPLVIDFALSVVARGKIMAAKQGGTSIPEGWALGPDGTPTSDPETALAGSMVPIGGAKGAALALMIEIMSACLAGAALGTEAGSLFEGEGDPPNLGQVILVIDASSLSAGNFAGRIKDLAAVYETLEGARFPGLKRLENRAKARRDGLQIAEPLMAEINQLAQG